MPRRSIDNATEGERMWDEVLTDDPDIAVEHEGEELAGRDDILDELQTNAPQSLNAAGMPAVQSIDAVLQATSGAEMTADFVIVTRGKTPNRHGNMVQIAPGPNGKGLIVDHYAKAPVVLFEHGYGGVPYPVGLSESPKGQLTVKLSKSRATARVHFTDAIPQAADVFRLVDARVLRMASIGFRPLKAMRLRVEAPSSAERQDGDVIDMAHYYGGLDFTESELFEWSITAVGADQGALRQAVELRKVGGEKLSAFSLPILQRLVTPTAPIVPGWNPPNTTQQTATPAAVALPTREIDGVTLSGPTDAVERMVARLSEPVLAAADVDTTPANGTNGVEQAAALVTVEQLQAAIEAAGASRMPAIDGLVEVLPGLIGQAIAQATAPVAAEQRRIMERIDNATGKLH